MKRLAPLLLLASASRMDQPSPAASADTEGYDLPEIESVELRLIGPLAKFERGQRLAEDNSVVEPASRIGLGSHGVLYGSYGEDEVRDTQVGSDRLLRVGDREIAADEQYVDYANGRLSYSVPDGKTDLVRSVDLGSGETKTYDLPSKVGGTVVASDGTLWAQIAAPGYAGQVYARIHPDGSVRYVELNATRLFTLVDVRGDAYLVDVLGEVFLAK